MAENLPKDFLAKLEAVTAKRAKLVIDHIRQHGHVTTEELRDLYGYDHPPRGPRDVRELGIPLVTFRVKGKHGRSIAAYRFPGPTDTSSSHQTGRRNFSKKFKQQLVDRDGSQCAICAGVFDPRYLQIDHRIPYLVAGEPPGDPNPKDYMLVCSSCNRAKSWSCENCRNGVQDKNPALCQTCYWANPLTHLHVALMPTRRLDITWAEGEVSEHDRLTKLSRAAQQPLPEFVKVILRKHLGKK